MTVAVEPEQLKGNAPEKGSRPEESPLAGLRERAGEATWETIRLLRLAVEFVVLLFVIVLPWLARAATVAFAAWSISCAYPVVSERLGGDPPAVVLALAVVLLLLAGALGAAQAAGAEPWGAFLGAGAAIYVLGQLVRLASPLSVALAVGAALTLIVMHFLHQQEDTEVDNAE